MTHSVLFHGLCCIWYLWNGFFYMNEQPKLSNIQITLDSFQVKYGKIDGITLTFPLILMIHCEKILLKWPQLAEVSVFFFKVFFVPAYQHCLHSKSRNIFGWCSREEVDCNIGLAQYFIKAFGSFCLKIQLF